MFTLAELDILMEAVGTLIAEYGERPERLRLQDKLRELRDERRAELNP